MHKSFLYFLSIILVGLSIPSISFAGAIFSLDNPTASRVYEAGKPILVSGTYDLAHWEGGACNGNFFILTKVDTVPIPSFNTFPSNKGTFAFYIKEPLAPGDHTLSLLVSRADKEGVCKGETYTIPHVHVVAAEAIATTSIDKIDKDVVMAPSSTSNSAPLQQRVMLPPQVVLETDSQKLAYGSKALLRWNIKNARLCEKKGDWDGAVLPQGILESKELLADASFTIQCVGDGGVASSTVNIAVGPKPISLSLTVNPSIALYDGTSTVSWNVEGDVDSCTAVGSGWSGQKSLRGREELNHLQENTTLLLMCKNREGVIKKTSVTILVLPPVTPTLSFELDGTNLVWHSKAATSCTASGAWTGKKELEGTTTISILHPGDEYRLSCVGAGGEAVRGLTVGGSGSAPSVTLTVPYPLVKEGATTPVSWDIEHGGRCWGSGDWEGVVDQGGTLMVGPVYEKRVYTLTCANEVGVTGTSLVLIPTTAVFSNGISTKSKMVTTAPTKTLLATPLFATNFFNLGEKLLAALRGPTH